MDFKLNDAGDLVFENGDLVLLEGVEAIAQHLRIRFRFFIGEWFLDTRVGMPLIQKVLVKSPNLPLVRKLFADAARTTPGVERVESVTLELDRGARQLSISLKARVLGDQPLTFTDELIL